MSPVSMFDPFEQMSFTGYIEPSTGRQENYLSLAHFIHSERVAGADEHYRKYLLQLADPELFRLEVDGVGSTSGENPGWNDIQVRLLYAGIYMQALSNRERYGQFLTEAKQLSIASCSFSNDLTVALGQFIEDVQSPKDNLKVVFLGANNDVSFIESCMSVIFARKTPQCLLSVEDDGCSLGTSMYARKEGASFSLLSASLSEEEISENIQRRCTHIFHFQGGEDSPLITSILHRLHDLGVLITPIQPKS